MPASSEIFALVPLPLLKTNGTTASTAPSASAAFTSGSSRNASSRRGRGAGMDCAHSLAASMACCKASSRVRPIASSSPANRETPRHELTRRPSIRTIPGRVTHGRFRNCTGNAGRERAMPRNGNGTTWKLRMLINIMLAAMAQLPALTVSIVSRISDARAYWRIGGSAARLIG